MRFEPSLIAFFTVIVTGIASGVASAATTEYFDHTSYTAAASPAVLVDFDALPKGNGVLTGNEFAGVGLEIIQRTGHPINLVDSADIAAGSGTTGTFSVNSSPTTISSSFFVSGFNDSLDDDYDFEFTAGASTAGVWIGNVGPGSTNVAFLDPTNAVIASETIDKNHVGIIGDLNANDTRIFYGITTDQVISRIRTSEVPGDSDGIVYDDVQFTVVPEPNSLILPATAAFTVLLWGRRKKVI